MSHVRTRSFLLLMPFAALSLAACGDDSAGSSYGTGSVATTAAPNTAADTVAPDTAPADSTPAATAAPDTASADTTVSTGTTTLQLADSTLGTILVDGDGNTLYLYGKDTPNAPACDTSCLGGWPALVSNGAATVGTGMDLEDVGTVTAADGSTQVTFYGHPLYSFAGDAAPGDVNGQGIGGVWYVIDAEGNAVK